MNPHAAAFRPPPPPARVSERALSLAIVIGLHGVAAGLLLTLAQPVLKEIFSEPLRVDLVSAREQTVPEPPKPVPVKPRPQAQRQQVAPQPAPAPVLQTAAPAPAETPVMQAAPAPKEAPPAVTAPAESSSKAGPPVAVAEAVQQARFDADYLQNPRPAYPSASRSLGEEGRVLLRVQVSEDGRALQVLVETSSGYQRLDRAAREAVANWRFVPARQGQQAVVGWVRVPLLFELNR